MTTTDTGRAADPLRALRALRKEGFAGRAAEVGLLLRRVTDPLDRESAGMLLSRPGAVEALTGGGALLPATVAVLASSTVSGLAPLLTAHLVERGVAPTVVETGFDRWREEALAGGPTLTPAAPRVTLLLLDDEVVFARAADPLDVDELARRCAATAAEIGQWTATARATWGGRVVLSTLHLGERRRRALRDHASRNRLDLAWHRMNTEILALTGDSAVTVLPIDGYGAGGAVEAPARTRLTSSQVFSTDLLDRVARDVAAITAAELGRTAKVLVLDLDNTLWGGVVGDDGPAGIVLGGAHPGNAFTALQTLAAALQRQGVLLAVCSKNEEAVAREAVDGHPEMVLRSSSFVGFHADWRPKPDNVALLAEQLNVGLDAMVFLDDNPVERDLMRRVHPGVATPEVDTPDGYVAVLQDSALFDLVELAETDRDRTQLYRARAAREEARSAAGSLTQHLHDLATHIDVAPMDGFSRPRIAQLFGKTNQFNLTGVRYSPDQLDAVRAAGGGVYGVRVGDRFGDNGLVAALTVLRDADGWHVANFVLSCRVFQRDIEVAVLADLLHSAQAAGVGRVTAEFVPSPRNGAFRELYPRLGFTADPAGDTPERLRFTHDLTRLPGTPDWVATSHHGAFHER